MPIIDIENPRKVGTLAAIREKFIDFSGRYDLENADGSDNGANFFINAGLKFLDRMLDNEKFASRYTKRLQICESLVRLPRCRIIKEVFVYDENLETKVMLKKLGYAEFSLAFPSDETKLVNGAPTYYVPLSLRTANEGVSDIALQANAADFLASDVEISAIRIAPPPDKVKIVEVYGQFYSPELLEDDDTNFWSVLYPEILIQAALVQLEKYMRNSEGLKDQLQALLMDIEQIDYDSVSEQINKVDQMEG